MRYRKDLDGLNIKLKCLDESDTDFIVDIRSDNNLNALSGNRITREIHRKWLADYLEKDDDIYWVAIEKSYGERIGTTSLFNIDFRAHKAEAGRTVVRVNYRQFAFEMFYLKAQYAFDVIGLNKLYGKVRDSQPHILHYNLKIGFQIEGFLRQDFWDGTQYVSYHLISMLKDEFYGNIDNYRKYLRLLMDLSNSHD